MKRAIVSNVEGSKKGKATAKKLWERSGENCDKEEHGKWNGKT